MPKYLTVALVAALLFAGCSDRNRQSSRPGQVSRDANPDLLVKNAVETRTSLSSIAGKGVMRIVDQPNKFGLTVNADVVADESNRLRIRADKLAGAIQAFDVVMLQDDIGFYVPTQNTLYHGKVNELQNFSFRFDPDEVLRQMLRPETSLLVKKWRHAEAIQGDPNNAVMVEEDVAPGAPRLRLAINKKNGMIASVTQFDGRGQPILVKRYDDYRDLSRSRKSSRVSQDDSVFPYLISFSWPRDRRLMEMHFKTVEGNAVVLDEDFEVATSSDTRYLPLMEAQMESDFGDEPLAELPREAPSGRAM